MEEIESLKRDKAKVKTAFTKKRHKFIQLLDEDLPSRRTVLQLQHELEQRLDDVMIRLNKMLDFYIKINENEAATKIVAELEKLEEDYSFEQNRAQEYLDSRMNDASSIASSNSEATMDGRSAMLAWEWTNHVH